MKVIWAKEKTQDFHYSSNSVTLHARASGDGASAASRCCRLCGAERCLRRLGDTCIWEGVEERYDQLLAECFGVRVSPSDAMMCDRCIGKLRNTQKFRALVHAAFELPASECSSLRAAIPLSSLASGNRSIRQRRSVLTKNSMDQTSFHHILEQPAGIQNIIKSTEDQVNFNKKILEYLNKKTGNPTKKQKKRNAVPPVVVNTKRTIVYCTICGQRYPMMLPKDDTRTFVCSRCKLKKNAERKSSCRKRNIVLPASAIKEITVQHAKIEPKGKGRHNSLTKKSPQLKKSENIARSILTHKGYQCSQCTQKYHTSRYLADHVRSAHGDTSECKCVICGRMCGTRYLLEQHMRKHTGEAIFECDICKRLFRNRQALQLHYLTHENFRLSK